MIYILFLLFSVLWLYQIRNYRQPEFSIAVTVGIPICILWVVIVGTQYMVGTDYQNYIAIFRGENLEYISLVRKEYVFSWLVSAILFFELPPQSGFVILSIVEAFLLIYIMWSCTRISQYYLFFFVFICFSGTFHNQMNGLRQYLSIYFVTVAICLLCKKKYFWVVALFILSTFIHKSSLLVAPIVLIIYVIRNRMDEKTLLLILFLGLLSSFVISNETLGVFIPYVNTYRHYIMNGMEEYSMTQRITKYIYIPLFVWAIYRLKYMKISQLERSLFVFGVVGFALKLSVMSLVHLSRLGLYLEIVSCVPLVYLLYDIYIRNKTLPFLFLVTYILLPYALKVMAIKTGEYSYDSILFHV